MAKEIKTIAKGTKAVERIIKGLKKDHKYWNKNIESILIITGYADGSEYFNRTEMEEFFSEDFFSEVVKGTYKDQLYCKETVKGKLPTVYVTGVYKYGDTLEEENLAAMGAVEWDYFANFGFVIKGRIYMTKYKIKDSSFWLFLDKFLKIETPKEEECNVLPIRWLGAFNTNAHIKRCGFEEVLRYETSRKQREVAAQIYVSLREAFEINDDTSAYICSDHLSASKIGVMYDTSSCRVGYEQDVWSTNVGPYLVANRNYLDTFDEEDHYLTAEEGFFLLLKQLCCNYYYDMETQYDKTNVCVEMTGEYFYARLEEKYYVYNGQYNINTMEEILEEGGYTFKEAISILRMYKNNEFSRKTIRRSFGNNIKRAIGRMEKRGNFKSFLCKPYTWNAHSEGFVRVGAKPTAIVVRGRIKDSNYEIVKRVAKEKGLEVLHF